jgi:cell wall-associated NlpC family hydrolase
MNHKRLTAAMFGAAIVAASLTASPAAAAPLRPAAIAGDSHSSAVASRAVETLAAYDALTRAGGTTRLIRYIGDRNATADAVAAEFGLDAGDVRQAWSRAGHQHQIAVLAALSQLGVEYRSNTSEPGVGFDCSGLTAYAWGRAGVSLYRQSGVQISNAAPRDHSSALAGDLVQYPGHVMMYLGVGDAIVHASNPETDVELSTLRDRSYSWGDPSA